MRYLILDGEDVGQVPVVAFSPQMATRLAGDELRADPQAASSFANTSFQDVADVHGSGDLLGVDDLAFESERAVASHDLQRRNLRKIGDDVLGDSIAEVFLLAIVAEIANGRTQIEIAAATEMSSVNFSRVWSAAIFVMADSKSSIGSLRASLCQGAKSMHCSRRNPSGGFAESRVAGTRRPKSRPSAASS